MMAPATISAMRTTGRPAARTTAPRPRSGRTTVAPRAGFLDFMTPKPEGGGAATGRRPSRATELVDQLLDLSSGTDAGLKASPSRRQEIDELVSELSAYCMRSPLRSDLIFGEWEVVYASKPQTAGGPFRSPIGRTVFPGQRAIQVITEPNLCVNEVSFKTLGFIPGAARQEGEIEPVNETTFQLTFPALDNKKRGAGGPPQRLIEVLYLDDKIRVARSVPQNEGDEGSFYVFARVEGEEEEEEEEEKPPPPAPKRRQARVQQEEEEEEEEKPARRAPAFSLFPARKSPAEGRATTAERAVARAGTGSTRGSQRMSTKQATQAGTQRRGAAAAAAAAPVRKTRDELAAERAAAAAEAKERAEEQRRARAEAAAEAKARAEEERAARAEAAAVARAAAEEERRAKADAAAAARASIEEERRAAREAAGAERAVAAQRQTAAKEAYAELAEAATEAADEAREAATVYKAAEKEAAALIRAAGQARGIIERAVAAAEEAAAELIAAQKQEFDADKDVLSGQRLLNALEKRLREVSAAVAPRIKK